MSTAPQVLSLAHKGIHSTVAQGGGQAVGVASIPTWGRHVRQTRELSLFSFIDDHVRTALCQHRVQQPTLPRPCALQHTLPARRVCFGLVHVRGPKDRQRNEANTAFELTYMMHTYRAAFRGVRCNNNGCMNPAYTGHAFCSKPCAPGGFELCFKRLSSSLIQSNLTAGRYIVDTASASK